MTHGHELSGGNVGGRGVGRMEWSEGGGKWDNCNSIINKYIKKIEKVTESLSLRIPSFQL